MTSGYRSFGFTLFAVLLAFTSGCGGSVGKPQGQVTLNGTPVVGAELRFQPEANPDAPVTGQSGEGGKYVLDFAKNGGIPVGKCTITIVYYTMPNGSPLPSGEQGAALRSDPDKIVRHEYVFEKEIVAGANALDFELTAGTKPIEAK